MSQLSLLSRNAERHADNPEFRADMVATLRSSVGKMNDLLARLSPQAQSRPQRADAQPLRSILSDAIAAKRRDHEVRLLGDSTLWAMVDAAALEQAVGHLVQNAVEASPSNEPVSVRVARAGNEVRITIVDKGCGMDGDFVRNRLFQPFASTKSDGFGIGSFEARSLVASMPGALEKDQRGYYDVMPIPPDWTEEQAASFLREYNKWAIYELTIHEGVPGHLLQLAHSNQYKSKLRAVLQSGPMVEGWACYGQDVMIVVAALWITALLLLGGFALDRVLTASIVRNFDEQLSYVLNAMSFRAKT